MTHALEACRVELQAIWLYRQQADVPYDGQDRIDMVVGPRQKVDVLGGPWMVSRHAANMRAPFKTNLSA